MNIVILAAGDFPTHPVPLKALREADFVICCDSAYRTIKNEELRIKNYVVIGDGDSLSENDKHNLGDRWIHVAEQDYNDLHKAMAWANEELRMKNEESRDASANSSFFTLHSSFKITILGATGKREDHTLGNISYLVTFAEEYPGIDLEMLTDHGRFCAISPRSTQANIHSGSHTFKSFPRQQVSLFTPDPTTRLTSTGLRWPLQDMCPRLWWQATLNEALADSFSLTTTGWVILFQTYEPKS